MADTSQAAAIVTLVLPCSVLILTPTEFALMIGFCRADNMPTDAFCAIAVQEVLLLLTYQFVQLLC